MIVGLCVGLVVGGCCALAVGQRQPPRRAALAKGRSGGARSAEECGQGCWGLANKDEYHACIRACFCAAYPNTCAVLKMDTGDAGRGVPPSIADTGIDPTTLPWLPSPVDMMIASGLQNGIRNPDALTAYVAQWVYPVSASGQRVGWPPVQGYPPIFNRIYQRILIRVHATLADAAERAAGG